MVRLSPWPTLTRMRRAGRLDPARPGLKWLVWAVGSGVFVLAIFHRTSLGVAGPLAAQRFSLSAAQLSSFVMLQLGVYAAMQVPSGVLIDRFGPRRMLLTATTLMGGAQIAFALVGTYPAALAARGLLGCGDAMTYLSVLRLVAGHFSQRRYAFMASLTGLLGTAGNVLSTLPLTLMLSDFGWSATFVMAGSLSLGYGVLLLRPVTGMSSRAQSGTARSSESRGDVGRAPRRRGPADLRPRIRTQLRAAWAIPAGRLAFWIHFTTVAGPQAFAVLWGYPYLVEGLGMSETAASAMLMVMVAVGAAGNIMVGLVAGRFPTARVWLSFCAVTVCLAGWAALVAWPGGRVPLGLVIVILVTFAMSRPTSIVGFLLVRDANPAHRISTATGLVNVGGHFGTVIVVYGIGQVLDLVDPGSGAYSLAAYRWAFAAVASFTAIGLWRIATWWARARRGCPGSTR